MCDYSLHALSFRPARSGEKLISTSFPNTITRGFAAEDERKVAVCLLPGTELGFEREVKHYQFWIWPRNAGYTVARFVKISASAHEHHDALEFPNGGIVLLDQLVPGQRARVVQLPVNAKELENIGRPEWAQELSQNPATDPQAINRRMPAD